MAPTELPRRWTMQPRVDVLDHGFVRLVDSMGSDLSIVRAARVSYDAAWRAGENTGSDARLINYLWSHRHTTPFEAVTFTFEVKAPIFVLRQWHRHRTWSFNELSARYRELPEEFYIPALHQVTTQATDNKQGRTSERHPKAASFRTRMDDNARRAFAYYEMLLAEGCPRELARSVLPLGTYSHMFATVNLLNLFRFLTLRVDSHAQYEIQVYAQTLLELVRPIVPAAVHAFESDWVKEVVQKETAELLEHKQITKSEAAEEEISDAK